MTAHFKLVIGNKSYSSWSLRAWLALKHFNLPFEEKVIALGQKILQKTSNNTPPQDGYRHSLLQM